MFPGVWKKFMKKYTRNWIAKTLLIPKNKRGFGWISWSLFLSWKCGTSQQKKSIYKITKNQPSNLTKCAWATIGVFSTYSMPKGKSLYKAMYGFLDLYAKNGWNLSNYMLRDWIYDRIPSWKYTEIADLKNYFLLNILSGQPFTDSILYASLLGKLAYRINYTICLAIVFIISYALLIFNNILP